MPPYPPFSKKNNYNFNIGSEYRIEISSNFDGGNISLIKQVNELQYRLESVADDFVSKGRKTWFYFSVKAGKEVKVRFNIENVSIYESMYQEENWPKPVQRIGLTGKWSTVKSSYLVYRDEANLIIDHQFTSQEPVYFALAIPFTYYEMENYLHDLRFTVPEMIDFKDEVIKETKTGKNLHMLTLEDKELKKHKDETGNKRSIILVTSRVHPGEVSSSYCLMGMLEFILKPFCLQSEILRKMFTFIIIPMVNPDGVYEGNYRMDLNGENLNRVYLEPDFVKHETVYAIRSHLEERVRNGDRIVFHFDLHAHSGLRRSFIYGNAFDDIIQQTETELFCKILDRNCTYFQENLCQFGERHMKFKDRGEAISKEGCARVVLSKMASISYSYTIESSIFPVQEKACLNGKNEKPLSTNLNLKVENKGEDNFPFSYDDFEPSDNKYLSEPNIIDQNKNLGINIMLSILDMMKKNPYSSLNEKDFDEMRKEVACRILQSEERFKMLDTKAYHKSKFISHFAKNEFESKFKHEWSWLAQCPQFEKVLWPEGFEWFKKEIIKEKVKKIPKLKTECREQRIYTRTENEPSYLRQLPQKTVSNRHIIKTENTESDEHKFNYQRLPIIQRSLEAKKVKTEENLFESPEKKLEKTENIKIGRNLLSTNRSNILLTFLEDVEEKREQRLISKKRILSLKMASINRNSGQKAALDDRINEIIFESLDSDFPGLKPSHSQGQLPITIFGEPEKYITEEGCEFEDKLLTKNYEVKKSRKELISRKISMLKKANESKKQANKNCFMKFPEIGKAFLVTNAKNRLEKVKKSTERLDNDEKSTIESNQKNYIIEFLYPDVTSIIKLKTQTSIS